MNQQQWKLGELLLPYDALVLIHPDMPSPGEMIGNPDYFENLELATYNMEAEEKPIFFLPRYPDLENWRIQQMSSPWKTIRSPNQMISKLTKENLQEQVNYMSRIIGKDPSEIRIAGGGTALGVCVTDFMYAWCDKVFGPYSSLKIEKNITTKLNEGTIIPELTDVTSLLL